MATITANRSVGEIAAEFPSSIRVFERHGIDYCCGGKTPLDEACLRRGVDPAALLAELDSKPATDDRDWTRAFASELIDHIVSTHHAYLNAELPRLEAALEKLLAKHGGRYPELQAAAPVFRALKAELESHLMKEEMVLFPIIRDLENGGAPPSHCGSVRNPVRVMCLEHDSAGDALAKLRTITAGYRLPEDACNTFRGFYHGLEELEGDLHRHIHLENNVLFPRAVELEAAAARG